MLCTGVLAKVGQKVKVYKFFILEDCMTTQGMIGDRLNMESTSRKP